MKLHTRILNGKIPQYSRNEIKNFLKKNEGKEISIEIKKISYQRSNPQNKFYWGVWIPIIQQALSELSGELVSIEETHNIVIIKKSLTKTQEKSQDAQSPPANYPPQNGNKNLSQKFKNGHLIFSISHCQNLTNN